MLTPRKREALLEVYHTPSVITFELNLFFLVHPVQWKHL